MLKKKYTWLPLSVGVVLTILLIPINNKPLIARAAYVLLSSYYVLPGQGVTVTGHGFNPHETVTVSGVGSGQVATASGSGQFSAVPSVIPFSASNSTQTISAGGSSGTNVAATLTVGSFYPVVTPSSWYVLPGSSVSFSAKSFGPNETISVYRGGSKLAEVTADAAGSLTTSSFPIAQSPRGKQEYIFTGNSSHVSRSVTITVADEPPYLLLNSYYAWAGSNLEVKGFAFGTSEPVDVWFNGTSFGHTVTNNQGQFTITGNVPVVGPGKITIRAVGAHTGKVAETQFTQADPALPH